MARRRKMDLRDIEVVVKTPGSAGGKLAAEQAAVEGRIRRRLVSKLIKLHGHFNDQELQILRNAARYCSVSQIFSGKAVEMSDELQVLE